jgi:hypothetical protein
MSSKRTHGITQYAIAFCAEISPVVNVSTSQSSNEPRPVEYLTLGSLAAIPFGGYKRKELLSAIYPMTICLRYDAQRCQRTCLP